jgi:hypothetical protein
MRTIKVLLIIAGIIIFGFANTVAEVTYDTTKVAGWQVLVPETKPVGWPIPFNMADSAYLSVQLTNEPSPLKQLNENYHSIMFTAGQTNGLFDNTYYFFKMYDTPIELDPFVTGKVTLLAEMKADNQGTTTNFVVHMGFVKNGIFYSQGPPATNPNVDPIWRLLNLYPLQDTNGNNPPQNGNGDVEIDNIIIMITAIGYNLRAELLVDNVQHKNGDLIDGMGDAITGIKPLPTANIPSDFLLKQNYPNPFNPETRFQFSVPYADEITISIYNLLGQMIESVTERFPAGTYEYSFTASLLPSGVYFYRLTTASGFSQTRKMILKK